MKKEQTVTLEMARPWWRRPRWLYAMASFALGVVYTGLALILGFEFRLGDRDVTILVGTLVEFSFAAFGFVIGLSVEARRRERAAAEQIQKQLEDLAAVRVKLAQKEKLASLGQLAGAVAHEVRNPLAILRSLVQNLEETLEPGATEGHETCGLLLEEIDRLAHVTSTLVGFARPLTLDRRRTSAVEIVSRADLLGRQMLSDRAVGLTLASYRGADAPLQVDSDLLCQVLLGLLENAAEASPEGEAVELGWSVAGSEVELTVTDHGEGIPEDLRDKVFEPFFTTRSRGSGLGLAVARQIVEAHGGEISVGSAADCGARFRVRLPVAEGPILEASEVAA